MHIKAFSVFCWTPILTSCWRRIWRRWRGITGCMRMPQLTNMRALNLNGCKSTKTSSSACVWTGLLTGRWPVEIESIIDRPVRITDWCIFAHWISKSKKHGCCRCASLGCSYGKLQGTALAAAAAATPLGYSYGKRIGSYCFSRFSVSIRQMLNSMAAFWFADCRLPIFPDCPLVWCSPYSRLQSTDTDCSTD